MSDTFVEPPTTFNVQREKVLEVRGLSLSVPTTTGRSLAVDGVDLDVYEGETLGLVGESGSGKSVTALAIIGLLHRSAVNIESGSVVVAGEELTGMPRHELRRRRGPVVSMIFQEPMTSLNPAFTIGDQISEGLRRHERLSRSAAKSRSIELLERVGIDDARHRYSDYPHRFSGGMLQRVMIAIAISCRPKLLLADEPTTALDVTVQKQILGLIDELREEMDMGVVFITHDLGVIAEVSQRTAVMYAGQIVETGTTEDLLVQPRHPYLEGLLGAVPQLDARQERLFEIPGSIPSPNQMPSGCRFYERCTYAEPGRCDSHSVPLTFAGSGRGDRCVRSGEISLGGVK